MSQAAGQIVDRDVVVVGGGFAGVATAQQLARHGVEVTLINQQRYTQFQPLLYQVATAQLGISEAAHPLRTVFNSNSGVQVVVSAVTAIDPRQRRITLDDGTTVQARVLVLATGAVPNFFGTPGAEEFAFPMYSLDDAVNLGTRLVNELNAAESIHGATGAVDVVVVGGGPTGVELAGAMAESLHSVIPEMFSDDLAKSSSVALVDMIDTVLAPFSSDSQKYTLRTLEELGVRLSLGSAVKEVRADSVELADGTTLPASVVVWAGGLKAPGLVGDVGLPQGRGGRVDVAADLTVPGFAGVYAVGDIANIPDGKGGALPQLGSVAQQSGRWAARNIRADLTGGERTEFRYRDKGIMAMIGRGAAVAELGSSRREIHGPIAFVAWLAVHAALLPSRWQRIGAARSWVVDYFTKSRPQVLLGKVGDIPPNDAR